MMVDVAERQHCGTCGTRLAAHGVCPRCVPSLRAAPKATVQGVGPPLSVQKVAAAQEAERGEPVGRREPVDTMPGYRSSRPPPPAALDLAAEERGSAEPAAAPAARAVVDTVPGHTAAAAKGAGKRKAPPPMTAVAGEAFTLTRAFNAAFARPFPGWQAELAAPVGPSTGGGAQALQHIALIAPSGERIAIGSVDPARHTATLRSHAMVDQLHRRRFRAPLPVAQPEFKRFQDMVSRLLAGASFAVTVATVVAPEPQAESAQRWWLWLLVLLLVIASASWWLLRSRG